MHSRWPFSISLAKTQWLTETRLLPRLSSSSQTTRNGPHGHWKAFWGPAVIPSSAPTQGSRRWKEPEPPNRISSSSTPRCRMCTASRSVECFAATLVSVPRPPSSLRHQDRPEGPNAWRHTEPGRGSSWASPSMGKRCCSSWVLSSNASWR
jgi:hypothetical protein